MRRISWIFVVLLGFASLVEAQPSGDNAAFKRWDVAATAALFNSTPGGDSGFYGDDWYFDGRYAASIGHYWTEHLKTELEYAISGEDSIYRQEFRQVPGVPYPYPYGVEVFHRLEQGAARLVWQFGENTWVHPYVSAGLVVDRDRSRIYAPAQFQNPSGRPGEIVLVTPEMNSAPTFDYRVGYSIGGGVKVYMTPNSFFTTGANITHSKPARTVSVLAGFGVDF